MLIAFAGRPKPHKRHSRAMGDAKPLMEGSPDSAAGCEFALQELPELALDIVFSFLDAQGLASASLSCTAWRARVASAPELFRYAFWSRFGGRTEGGWWPFFEQEQQLFGHTDWLDLYQATLLGECELETRVLREALRRQLYHREQYQKALDANRQVVLVCERSLEKSEAALVRYLRPMRGLLFFGRKGQVTEASLKREVDHWRRELHAEQAAVRTLEPLLAQALGKVDGIQARLRALARQRAALLDARPGLETSELLHAMLNKVALPRLRARISAAYMYYDKAAHAVR